MQNIGKMKDLYLDQYKKYINNPTENLIPMCKMIICCKDFASLWSEDLFIECRKSEFHNKTKNFFPYTLLETNGSTGLKSQKYRWGPNFRTIADYIWDCMHRTDYIFENRYSIFYGNKNRIMNTQKNDEGIKLSLNPESKIDIQIEKSAFILSPSMLSVMIKFPFFIDFIKKNAAVISITGSDGSYFDFSILQELKIPLINQMRSWKEGTAFYTCPYNQEHWMENLFYCTENKKVFDLFNFHNNWWQNKNENPDNIWVLDKNFKQCQCKRWYRTLNFQPHAKKYFYDYLGEPCVRSSILEKNIFNKYHNLQIIQKKDLRTFEIHADENISNQDFNNIKKKIFKIYKSYNFDVNIVKERYTVGKNKKIPIFWSEYEYDHNRSGEEAFISL